MTNASQRFTPPILSQVLQDHLPARRWLVGFSGGLDSSVLLHALVATQPEQPVVAIHVNHGLSEGADDWQRHCEARCRELGVECRVEKVAVQPRGRGLEEAARRARYQAFQRHMEEGDVLLLGHHRDDQAETLLFRLMRGAGPRGLGSIAPQRDFAGGRIARPLLAFSKTSLERYATELGVSWISDESNMDEALDRNFLRRQVLPLLAQRWPGFTERWRLTAEACQEADRLSCDLGVLDLRNCGEVAERWGWSVDWHCLADLPGYRRRNVLRTWALRRGYEAMERKQLAEIHKQFFAAGQPEGQAVVQWAEAALRYWRGRVYLTPGERYLPGAEPVSWSLDRELVLADGTRLSAQPAPRGLRAPDGQQVEIRWRQGGERCRPAGRRHSQTLKKLLQEYPLEPWLRNRVPLLYVQGQLAAVGDLWVCESFVSDESGYQIQWYAGE